MLTAMIFAMPGSMTESLKSVSQSLLQVRITDALMQKMHTGKLLDCYVNRT